MEKERFHLLFNKYVQNTLTEEESEELGMYLDNPLLDSELKNAISEVIDAEGDMEVDDSLVQEVVNGLEDKVWSQVGRDHRTSSRLPSYTRLVAASIAVIVSVGLGLFYYSYRHDSNDGGQYAAYHHDVEPGTNKATLVFSDGNAIELSGEKNGIQMFDQGISYADGTTVVDDTPEQYVTLAVPRAGQYQLVLSDGTKVWLNASSSLRYPIRFGDDERKVELQGEAYFEVSSDKGRPFLVKSKEQTVQVVGTSFNVSAYTDEKRVVTTLVEGSIILHHEDHTTNSSGRTLVPGEQAVWSENGIGVKLVDVNLYTGWKNGLIVFDQADLPAIVRQIERWYDVTFELPKLPDTERIYGEVRRDANLSEILRVLQLNYGLTFKMEGRRVIVSR